MKKFILSLALLSGILQMSFGQDSSKGQLDGNVSLNLGTNFVMDMSSRTFSNCAGDFSAWGRYRTEKLMIKLDLQGLNSFVATTIQGQTIDLRTQDAPEMNMDITQKENSVLEEKAGVLVEYKPDNGNEFSFNVRQGFNRQTPDKAVISIINRFDALDYENMEMFCSFDLEEVLQKENTVDAVAEWKHRFDKPGREIVSGIGWALSRTDKSSNWHITPVTEVLPEEESEEEEVPDRIYRITPLYTKNDISASVTYRDVDMFSQKSLNLELGMNLKAEFDRNMQSAANFINEEWIDSLEYRENFSYFSLNAIPKAKVSYSPGKFKINFQLTPDFYVNNLHNDKSKGELKFGKVYLLPCLDADWTPSQKHNLGISYRQGIVRPSFLQMCRFPRIGAYSNEMLMGNPDLTPGSSSKISLLYTFKSGYFTGNVTGTTTVNWDNIEKVFNNVGDYRIYTWINSGHSIENNIKLSAKAKLKNFEASLEGYYNYFIGYNNSGAVTRSSDWGINGDATLSVRGGWSFNVKGRYQSKIIRTYNSITEYIGCDARITKDFRKFSVFVQGKDLFDQTIEVATYSEDQTYARIEEIQYNRRIFSIGAAFKF